MTYEERRNPALPWGYWLLANDGVGGSGLLDEEGRRWSSVREAFWVDRLGMDGSRKDLMDTELERLLAVLATYDRRTVPIDEAAHDLFAGENAFYFFYRQWLYAVRLLADAGTGGGPLGAPISVEGRAALLMLASTRSAGVRSVPVGVAAIRILSGEPGPRPEVELWFARIEEYAAGLRFGFRRHEIWRKPAIVLIGRALDGAVPISRTLWSQTFASAASRDRFMHWLCVRLDRWEAWGTMAYEHGGQRLTQHLLALLATGPPSGEKRRVALLAPAKRS